MHRVDGATSHLCGFRTPFIVHTFTHCTPLSVVQDFYSPLWPVCLFFRFGGLYQTHFWWQTNSALDKCARRQKGKNYRIKSIHCTQRMRAILTAFTNRKEPLRKQHHTPHRFKLARARPATHPRAENTTRVERATNLGTCENTQRPPHVERARLVARSLPGRSYRCCLSPVTKPRPLNLPQRCY